MPPPDLGDWLERAGAHHDLVEWAGEFGSNWPRAWETCPRGDWLLALAARLGMERTLLVKAAAACAALALDDLPDPGSGPARAALEAAREFAAGRGSAAECEAAADAAERSAQSAAHGSASAATLATAAAARAALDPGAAAGAAALAVEAAVVSAGDCAMMSALAFMQDRTAKEVRQVLPYARLAPHLPRGAADPAS